MVSVVPAVSVHGAGAPHVICAAAGEAAGVGPNTCSPTIPCSARRSIEAATAARRGSKCVPAQRVISATTKEPVLVVTHRRL